MVSETDRKGSSCQPRRGACDACKKRKIRCKGDGKIPRGRCARCTTLGIDCIRPDLTKALTSTNGYAAALEGRIDKMERFLIELLPGIDFAEQLENENDVELLLPQHVETLPRNDGDLADGLNKLKLNPGKQRFYGKSSGIQFLQTVFSFRAHLAGVEFSQMRRTGAFAKRDEFWGLRSWQLPPADEDIPQYSFPEPDLLLHLVDKYFAEVNSFWPVLHRPTLERKVADELHLRDRRFGGTLLMVAALGARYSDDPRVILPDQTLHYAGWKWYSQVRVIPRHLIYKPELYELQTVALSALYPKAFGPTAACWTLVGFGLRRAQDVGAHRRRKQEHPTAENEQWKRVFWVLLCLEWVYGTHMGRPLLMHDQDFDQELPVECDDEYWDFPGPQNFKQPKDKPSRLSYFICYAKLLEIQAAATTTLYSPRKPHDLSGRSSPPTEKQYITAFDSALNAWLNDIPEHLRWDPERQNIIHFKQSALLYAAYYNVQILVHRPFIPAPFEVPPPGALPSYVICSNAARQCVRIFDVYERRGILPYYPNILPVAFVAAVVLLSSWSGKKTSSKELDQVHSCLRLTSGAENRYLAAGRYTDVLNRLLYASESLNQLSSENPQFPPPSARRDETSATTQRLGTDRASQWPASLIQDFEAALDQMDQVDQPFDSRLPGQYPENSLDGSFTHLAQMYQLELPTNINMPLFPGDMAANTDVIAQWSAAPSDFNVDEWSYVIPELMSSPQCEEFSDVATETNLPGYLNPQQGENFYI
ncbi:fungal-specific transcription factor domain-containing protein [Mycena galopus ATCC 62051]|nr:fungal-specific transcription factor domain-containing protein [Mycena galopus ATCC 62051]